MRDIQKMIEEAIEALKAATAKRVSSGVILADAQAVSTASQREENIIHAALIDMIGAMAGDPEALGRHELRLDTIDRGSRDGLTCKVHDIQVSRTRRAPC